MSEIKLKAVISKAQITPFHKLNGKANDEPVEIGGKSFGVGALRYDGFAGAIDIETGLYPGVVTFTPIDPSSDTADFTEIVSAVELASKQES